MKRILTAAAVLGLVVIPSAALASRSNDGDEAQAEFISAVREPGNTNGDSNTEGVKTEQEAELPEGSISEEQAMNIAQTQRPNSIISKVEIEKEDGVVVYSVRFTDDGRVDVRALDGAVVRLEPIEDNTSQGTSDSGSTNTTRDDSSPDDNDDDEDEDDEDDDDGRGRHRRGSNRGRH